VSPEFDPGTVRVIRHCRVVAYVVARDSSGNWRVIAEGQEDEAQLLADELRGQCEGGTA
jgi:hypothetical protein